METGNTTSMTNTTTVNAAYTVPTQTPPQTPATEQPTSVVGFWTYVGLLVLFAVPVVGLICNIVFACGVLKQPNITNLSRAYLAIQLVGVLLVVMLSVALIVPLVQIVTGIATELNALTPEISDYTEQFERGELTEDQLIELLIPYVQGILERELGQELTEEEVEEFLEEYIRNGYDEDEWNRFDDDAHDWLVNSGQGDWADAVA